MNDVLRVGAIPSKGEGPTLTMPFLSARDVEEGSEVHIREEGGPVASDVVYDLPCFTGALPPEVFVEEPPLPLGEDIASQPSILGFQPFSVPDCWELERGLILPRFLKGGLFSMADRCSQLLGT